MREQLLVCMAERTMTIKKTCLTRFPRSSSSLYAHEYHLKHIRRHSYPRVSRLYEVGDRSSRIIQAVHIANLGAISERSIERIYLSISFASDASCGRTPVLVALMPREFSSTL